MSGRETPRPGKILPGRFSRSAAMSDIDRIRRTHARYAMLLDDFRSDEWADLFTEDAAWISNTGIYEATDGPPITEARGRTAIVRIGEEFARQVGEAEAKW